MYMTATSLDCYCSAFCVDNSSSTEGILYDVTKWESYFYDFSLA